jgi:hypothetical protein
VRWQAKRDTAFVTAGTIESAVVAPLWRRTPYGCMVKMDPPVSYHYNHWLSETPIVKLNGQKRLT